MVARERPNGDLDPWQGAGEPTIMDLAWADRAPLEERNAMSLSTHDIRPAATAPDGAVQPRTVVVGYDGSDEARAAFAVAIDRAQPSDRIVLVHATSSASNWLGTPYYERRRRADPRRGRARARRDAADRRAGRDADRVLGA